MCLPLCAFSFLPMHVVQSSLTFSSLGGSKHLKIKLICISQQYLCLSSLGSGREAILWGLEVTVGGKHCVDPA